ncbi:MAG: type I methionyl aminopeptidase [Sandaracinaceae bacterium]
MGFERLGPRQVAKMRAAGAVAAATLAHVGSRLALGMSAAEIDRLVREDTARRGARPSQLGYHGFPGAVCVSRNDVVCHGVPREDDRLAEGDVVSVDVTSELDGWHGDTCATFAIGEVTPEAAHLIETARRCRDRGIGEVRDGVRIGDVGACIEELAEREGCTVVREVGGHGIGRAMHLAPHVGHHGPSRSGPRLRAGMAITIEPILILGRARLVLDVDGWTLRTSGGQLAAQFEHTILVTRAGAEVLTR